MIVQELTMKSLKKVSLWIGFILLLMGTYLPTMAQEASGNDWTISVETTPAQCQSDGVVKVTNQNSDALYNFTYSLQEVSLAQPAKTSSNSTFLNVPPGTYTVVANAQLKTNADIKFTRTIENVIVTGNYKVLDVTYNPTLSRPSYIGCNKGTIVLNVINGRQEDLTFRIISAPAGFNTPLDVNASRNEDGTYTLAGDNYPAGAYQIEISDNCVVRSVDLVVSQLTKLPQFSTENYTIVTAKPANHFLIAPGSTYTCSSPFIETQLNSTTTSNKELMRYIREGMFEIGLSPVDQTPRDDQFQTLLAYGYTAYALDMSPNTLSESYSTSNRKTHKVIIRLKDCPEISREFYIHFRVPELQTLLPAKPGECGKYTEGYRLNYDFQGLYCYPITINLKESSTGPVVKTETFTSPTGNLYSQLILDYGKTYYYDVVDANGKTVKSSSFVKTGSVYLGTTYNVECGEKYIAPYKFPSLDTCLPYTAQIINSGTNEKVHEVLVTSTDELLSPPLEFNVNYQFIALKDGASFVGRQWKSKDNFIIYPISSLTCRRDVGDIKAANHSLSNKPHTYVIRQGTKEIFRKKLDKPDSNLSLYDIYLPAGHYQFDIISEGCPTTTHEFDWKGFYNRENFSYDSQITCEGLEITPRGVITDQGRKVPNETYFRILSGPEGGYTKSIVAAGSKIVLTQNGQYQLGIMASNAYSCAIDTITINFQRPPLKLATEFTTAYACADGTRTGHILIKAQDGTPPYRYELWNEDNTQAIIDANGKKVVPLETLANGVMHFVYGVANNHFTIRVYDKCNNMFAQSIKISDLTTLTIAYAHDKEVCVGESIHLFALPLENYEWYYPDAPPTAQPFSREQNPIIPNAKVENSGLYKLIFKPQFCGKGIEGYVNITVHPCYVPINPQLMTKVMK